jgi:hypothetical protein
MGWSEQGFTWMIASGCAQVVVSNTAPVLQEEEALYASPEELLSQGAAASPKSDVYSLGVLFFELFNPVNDEVHIISHRIASHRIASHRTTSHHITSHHIVCMLLRV